MALLEPKNQQKPGIFTGSSVTLSQSIRQGQTSWIGSLVVRESRDLRDNFFEKKTLKNRHFGLHFLSRNQTETAVPSSEFVYFQFRILGAEKPTWGEGKTSKLASQYSSCGIYKHAPPAF